MKPKKLLENHKSSFPMIVKGMDKGYHFTQQYNPELAELLRQIFIILMRPIIALRAKLYRYILYPFRKLETQNIPIFRIGIGLILIIFISQNNFSFSISVNDPSQLSTMAAIPENISNHEDNYPTTSPDYSSYAKPISEKNEFAPVSSQNIKTNSAKDYILRYKDLAISEMKKHGIPASITLAQALIESRAGSSRLAVNNNNHFGIKCFSKKCSKGHCTNHKDDHHKDFFRKYKSPWESYRDHSKFLLRDRYKNLQQHKKDYKKWAVGLKKAGYATDKRYDKKLIGVIQKYKLYQYDK